MCAGGRGSMIRCMIAMLTLAAAGMLIPAITLWASDRPASS